LSVAVRVTVYSPGVAEVWFLVLVEVVTGALLPAGSVMVTSCVAVAALPHTSLTDRVTVKVPLVE
jgi:hypothetical protein